MDINKMRNIVILKDLPSNIVDEALVVLKKNQKVKKLEYIENKNEKFLENKEGKNEEEYVIKEAELLISNYINELENKDLKTNQNELILMKKYKKLKWVTAILGCFLFFCCIYILNL